MTIGRYGQLDKTKDARLLRRWYNPFPVKWFHGRIDHFFEQVHEVIGADGGNELTEGIERAYMVNRLLQLSVLYNAIYSAMVVKAGIDITLLMMGRKPGKVENLDYYKEQVRDMTGIEIKEIGDIIKLRDEMTRLTDKFQERFNTTSTQESTEAPSFYRGVMAVFSLMEMTYTDRMTLAEFGELKTLADERRRQIEKQMEKYETKD